MTTIAKTRKILSQVQSSLSEGNRDTVIRELQDRVRELQQAVVELQSLQLPSRSLETDGTPLHGSKCELLDAQYLRLVQSGAAGIVVNVTHGLRRKPQGIIWVLSGTSNNQALVAGDATNNIQPADATQLSIRLNGNSGDIHVGILF